MMRTVKVSLALAVGLVVLVGAVSLQAKGRSITLYDRAQLNEGVLEPGSYRVELAENSGGQEVMFYRGKHLVAKAPVLSQKQERKIERNSVRLSVGNGGNPRIVEIRFAGEVEVYKVQDDSKSANQRAS